MEQSLTTLLGIVFCLAFALILLFWAKRRREKKWPSPSNESFVTKGVPLFAMSLGILIGSFFPSWLSGQGLLTPVYALFICGLIGVPEVLLIRRLPAKFSSAYLLDGSTFPYFAIGFSAALIVFS